MIYDIFASMLKERETLDLPLMAWEKYEKNQRKLLLIFKFSNK
jgi:hypothetical protein